MAIDYKKLESAYRQYKKFKIKLEAAIRFNKQLNIKVEKDLKKICRLGVKNFYDGYYPKYYNRTYDLYHAYKVVVDLDGECDWEVIYSHEFMKKKHGMRNGVSTVGNDYIFQNSFMEGVHGGAKKISSEKAVIWGEHPEPGIPYWREYHPSQIEDGEIPWEFWGQPAAATYPSPYTYIEEKAQEYINKSQKMYTETIDDLYDEFEILEKMIREALI